MVLKNKGRNGNMRLKGKEKQRKRIVLDHLSKVPEKWIYPNIHHNQGEQRDGKQNKNTNVTTYENFILYNDAAIDKFLNLNYIKVEKGFMF